MTSVMTSLDAVDAEDTELIHNQMSIRKYGL
jgi:hypothetical protein